MCLPFPPVCPAHLKPFASSLQGFSNCFQVGGEKKKKDVGHGADSILKTSVITKPDGIPSCDSWEWPRVGSRIFTDNRHSALYLERADTEGCS